jgi:beta-phosphoglucomutase-like phosphatase (HAD superfamily)
MHISGFIFDFDGLILDTEMAHFTAWQEEFNRFGQEIVFSEWVQDHWFR